MSTPPYGSVSFLRTLVRSERRFVLKMSIDVSSDIRHRARPDDLDDPVEPPARIDVAPQATARPRAGSVPVTPLKPPSTSRYQP